MQRKGNLSALPVGMQTGAASMENSMVFPQKVKNGADIRASDPASGHQSEIIYAPLFSCSIIYNSQDPETAQVPIHR